MKYLRPLSDRSRLKAATTLIVALALYTLVRLLEQEIVALRQPRIAAGACCGATLNDDAGVYDERFRAMRADLPGMGVVGYISDRPAPGVLSREAADAYKHFLMTRYALAPLSLSEDVGRGEYVVGNFSTPRPPARIWEEAGLDLVRDFGDGVLLFRRPARVK